MEVFAWILLVIVGIIAVLSLIPIGFLLMYLLGMSFDNPSSQTDTESWLVRLAMLVIALGAGSLFPALVYYSYMALQANNPARAVLLLSIGLATALIGLMFFFTYRKLSNKESKKERIEREIKEKAADEERKRQEAETTEASKRAEMAKAAVRIAINEEKNGCKITMADNYTYENLKFFAYELKINTSHDSGQYVHWKKEALILDEQQPVELDFSNLPDNKKAEEYSVDMLVDEYKKLLSFRFQKRNGNLEALTF